MNTTRAMLVIGILMLVLAVIVAQGLSPENNTSQATISGTVSNENIMTENQAINGNSSSSVSSNTDTQSSSSLPSSSSLTPEAQAEQAHKMATEVAKLDEIKRDLANAKDDIETAKQLAEQAKTEINNELAKGDIDNANALEKEAVSKEQEAKKEEAQIEKSEPSKKVEAVKKDASTKSNTMIITTRAPKDTTGYKNFVTLSRLEVDNNAFIFRFSGSNKLAGKAFLLKEPNRAVIDLDEEWLINLPKVPRNYTLQEIRDGKQENGTRLVFDLKFTPKSARLVQINPTTLELQVK